MALSKTVLSLAAKIARRAEQGYLDYIEACESYRRDGYRPHYCEHGTNLWTEYDNICGPCEDGLSMSDGVTRRAYALDSAKRRDADLRALLAACEVLRGQGVEVDMGPVWKRVESLLTVQ